MNRPFALLFAALALVVVALVAVFWPGGDARDASDTAGAATTVEAQMAADEADAGAVAASETEPDVDADVEPDVEPAAASEAADGTEGAEADPAQADPGQGDAAPEGAAPDAADPDDAATADGADATDALPPVPVPDGYEALEPLVDERRVAFEATDDVLDASLDYAAVIETNRGAIVVDLFEVETPATVNNFVFLARHLYYDGIVFHRVIDGFMAQTGDPTGTGTGGPGYQFADEIVEGLGHDGPGVLSMANAGPGTNGSQFFLTFDATPWLDGAHTVFGRVVDGLPVLDTIHRIDPQQPPTAYALLNAPVSEIRDQGIDLPGDGTVEEALTTALGAPLVPGQEYAVAGARVVIGFVSEEPAAGFFPFPDRMERVTIVVRPRE